MMRMKGEQLDINQCKTGRILKRSYFSKYRSFNRNKKMINRNLLESVAELEPIEIIEESVSNLEELMDRFQFINDQIRLLSNLEDMDGAWWNNNFQITRSDFETRKKNFIQLRFDVVMKMRTLFTHISMGVDSNGNAVNPVGNIIEKNILKWVRAHDYNKKMYEFRTPVYIKLKKYNRGQRSSIKISMKAKYMRIKKELKDWRNGRCQRFNGFARAICTDIQSWE